LIVLRGRHCLSSNTRAVFLVVLLIAAGGSSAAQAAQITATRLDGTSLGGELRDLNERDVVVATAAGEQRIPVEKLISLRWQDAASANKPVRGAEGLAELVDGTMVPMRGLMVTGKEASITLGNSEDSQAATIQLPVSQLAAIRFQQLDVNLEKQWDEIRGQKLASDLLVVFKRDGKSLDYVEGVVGGIGEEHVEFKIDGESNRVDRSKVAGVVYYRNERRPLGEIRIALAGRSGLRASIAKARIVDNRNIEFTTMGGARVTWPLDDIQVADFSAGKIKYLSDLEPATQSWSPLVGLPAGLSLAAEYGQPRRDRSAFGGKLSVVQKNDSKDDLASPGERREFDKGLAVRSRTELVYRLPAGFSRFRTLAGIDPAATTSGNVQLTIMADDATLLETEIASNAAPQPIDVEIAGAKRLRILVDFGQNQDSGDWLNLCDAKLVK
jgi:hypothetical protein